MIFFLQRCKPIINSSVLPNFISLTDERIDQLTIWNDDIALIRNINPNKAIGSDGISVQMLLLCDDSVMLPLKIIFRNILFTYIYPNIWRLANVTPIFKKVDKQLIKNYRPISLLHICGKLDQMYIALVRSHLDYGDIIYHMPSKQNQAPLGMTLNSVMEKVERIQYQSALANSDAWHGSSRTKLYKELGWVSLSDRRIGRRILQIHKIFNNMTPSYLNDKLSPKCRALFSGNTCNMFHQIICKSNRYNE